jgi:hypothetical protein
MQRRRVGGLGLAHEPSLGLPDDGVYRRPLMLCSPIMDPQQPCARMGDQHVRQKRRELPLAHGGAAMVVGAPRQRGDRPLDRHLTRGISRRDLRHLVHHAPRRGQRRMATPRRVVHNAQLPGLWPVLQPRLQRTRKGPLRLRRGLQVAVAQPAPAKSPRMQQLAPPLPAVRPPEAGLDEVPDPRGGPQGHVGARPPRTVADRVCDLRPWRCRESRRAPRDRGPLQPAQPGLMARVHPGRMVSASRSSHGAPSGQLFPSINRTMA